MIALAGSYRAKAIKKIGGKAMYCMMLTNG